jgi:hypothetical protein
MNAVPQRYFFIHVMKTAGTSFVRQLQQQFPAEAVYPCPTIDWIGSHDFEAYINIPRLLALGPQRRAEIRMYTGHFPFYVTEAIDPGMKTLTMLRHPMDRTISVLKHFKRDEPRFRDSSLDEIYDDRTTFRFFVENHQTKVFSLAAEDGEDAINCGLTLDDARFARARTQLGRIDVLGLTERYDEFCEELRRRFGWWPGGVDTAAHSNVSPQGGEASAALRARIEADNAYDFELYELARELVRSR